MEDLGEGLAPVEDLSAAHVAGAEGGDDFVGGDHLLVARRDLRAAEWDMEVSQYEGELAHLFLF